MNKKLILLDNEYYVIDDSKLNLNDWILDINRLKKIRQIKTQHLLDDLFEFEKRITHSTQKLDNVILLNRNDIEEVIYGYSIEKLAENYVKEIEDIDVPYMHGLFYGYLEGFNTHKELVKDKLFTKEDMEYCYNTAKRKAIMQEAGLEADLGFEDYMIKYHTKPTQWNISIFEDNKIILI